MRCLLLLLVLTFGCATLRPPLSLEKGVAEFEQACGVPVSFSISLAPASYFEGNAVGYCFIGEGLRAVVLSGEEWSRSPDNRRRWLLFHELGHCALGIDHDDKLRLDGAPASIMHSYLPPNADKLWSDGYVRELCARPRGGIF